MKYLKTFESYENKIEDINNIFQELFYNFPELQFQIFPKEDRKIALQKNGKASTTLHDYKPWDGFNVISKGFGFSYRDKEDILRDVKSKLSRIKENQLDDEIRGRLLDIGYQCDGPKIIKGRINSSYFHIVFFCKKI